MAETDNDAYPEIPGYPYARVEQFLTDAMHEAGFDRFDRVRWERGDMYLSGFGFPLSHDEWMVWRRAMELAVALFGYWIPGERLACRSCVHDGNGDQCAKGDCARGVLI